MQVVISHFSKSFFFKVYDINYSNTIHTDEKLILFERYALDLWTILKK